jgi:hypothetical protein
MGSFNVAGTMSRLSISPGDKVVFFILTPNPNKYPIKGTNLVSNDGASMFFCPRFLPIVGVYNDYGGICSIEPDANVQYIQEYFGGIDIDEIVAQVGRNRWGGLDIECNNNVQELLEFSGMFELYSVYQDMVAFNKQNNNALKRMHLSREVLGLMGFKFMPQSTGDVRYKLYFAHPDIKDYAIFCDGDYSILSHLESGKVERAYSAKDVIEFFPHIKFAGLDKLEQQCIYSFRVEQAIAVMLEIQKLEAEHGIEAWMHIRKKPEDYCYHLRLWKQMIYVIEQAANYQFGLEEAFVDLLNFDMAMYSTNNFYYPGMNGEQFGNHAASKALCESSMRFLAEQK